ncbi:MAG TPA: PASTA domain-containing protein [Blastocatellia bacterium]|nr:PASTA domain-containing protein [Blastocatellia bacterium]
MNSRQGASGAASGNIAWTLSRRLGMVIVLALAFFLSAIVTIYTLFRSGDTQVPNVVGRSQTEAQKLAEQAGLRVKIQMRNDAAVPANSVIETRPGANSSVKKDSVLTIVVSSGPQTKSQNVSVPGFQFLVSSYGARSRLGKNVGLERPETANPKPETIFIL